MHNIAQVAVVRRRGVAREGVDLRGIGHWQFGAGMEPQRGVWCPAALPGEITNDPGGLEPRAECRAGERAGDQHRRVLDGLRGEVGRGGPGQELSQFARDGHHVLLLAGSGS